MVKSFNPSTLKELSPWLNLYSENLCAKMFPGSIHNLNNFLHLIKMQLSLTKQKIKQKKELDNLEKKIEQVEGVEKKIDLFLNIIKERDFYVSFDSSPIELAAFLNWLQDYWQNHLLFKHQVQLYVENNLSKINIIPFLLTFSLEQGLLNALEEIKDNNSDNKIYLTLDKNNSFLQVELTSLTTLTVKDPFAPFVSTKENHLGLGLTLVKKLLELYKGSASIQTNSEKHTTSLTLSIPIN